MNINEVHIPTVGGAINVVSQKRRRNATFFSYYTLVSQTGINDPTEIVLEDTFIPALPLARVDVGVYTLGSAGTFDGDKLLLVAGNSKTAKEIVEVHFNGTEIEIRTYDNAGNLSDDILDKTTIKVDMQDEPKPTTDEEFFEDLIEDLDKNQERIWTKIVMRDGLVVTEVDGATYRATLDYNSSIKTIES